MYSSHNATRKALALRIARSSYSQQTLLKLNGGKGSLQCLYLRSLSFLLRVPRHYCETFWSSCDMHSRQDNVFAPRAHNQSMPTIAIIFNHRAKNSCGILSKAGTGYELLNFAIEHSEGHTNLIPVATHLNATSSSRMMLSPTRCTFTWFRCSCSRMCKICNNIECKRVFEGR